MGVDLSHGTGDDAIGDNGASLRTRTDPTAQLRTVGDPVIGLRIWGTDVAHPFPTHFERLTIGRDPSNDIVIDHETVSRRHATLEWRGAHLVVVHQGGKNLTWSGGQGHAILHLTAGTVVRFGGVDVLAESARTQQLRAGFQRFLGFDYTAHANVDTAQLATLRRRHLALVGPPGAVSLARFVHDAAPNNTWPFVVANKLPADKAGQRALLAGAACGTLVVAAERLLRQPAPLLCESIATDAYHARLVVLAEPTTNLEAALGAVLRSSDLLTTVWVPALSARRAELPQLVGERIAHHASRAGATRQMVRPDEIARLHAYDWPGGHDELDEVVGRLVLLRTLGVNEAERRLGLGKGTLSKWARRYRFATK